MWGYHPHGRWAELRAVRARERKDMMETLLFAQSGFWLPTGRPGPEKERSFDGKEGGEVKKHLHFVLKGLRTSACPYVHRCVCQGSVFYQISYRVTTFGTWTYFAGPIYRTQKNGKYEINMNITIYTDSAA